MSKLQQLKIREELLKSTFTRPDWTKSSRRSSTLLFLDKNENTAELYVDLIKRVAYGACLDDINYYPDCALLYNKLGKQLDMPADCILLGAGSDGVIRYVFETFVSRGDAVVYTEPTFAMYSVYSEMFGAKSCRVGYKIKSGQLELDIDTFLKAIRDNEPTLVCLPNPDSPTGTTVSEEDLILIVESASKVGAAVLIDEAYYPFSEYTALPLIKFHSNLIVSRTFSKAWGLAGARAGFAVANHELITYMHKVRPMYELGALSVAVVVKVLDYQREMLDSVKRLNDGRNYFKQQMECLGFKTLSSAGNFQHVAFGQHAFEIHAKLKDVVVYRQDFPGTVLDGYSRFSSTTRDLFQQIVGQIDSVLQKHSQSA